MRTSIVGTALVLLLVLLAALPGYAQVDYATATLKGTVLDPQGAAVGGATVTVTNLSTGISRTVKTGAEGTFQFSALHPGTYKVQVEAQGFEKTIASNLQLSVGQVVVNDVNLKVGAVTDVVEIEAAPPLIATEQTQQANTINESQVDLLPNLGRNITQAIYTLPGVSDANAPRSQQPGFTGFFTTGFSIGGKNGRNSLSTIDGGENEYGTGQYRVTTIPLEGIQEFQVNRNGYNAEFGFTDGSAINIVTRSGANLLHGSAFGYFQDHSTSATNFFNGIEGLPAAYSQNVYTGFTLGGPVKKDKLFWYLAYEYQNLNTADFTNANVISAPTVVGPSAAQTSYVAALKASGNPFLVGFATGITPGLTPLNNPALNTTLTAESAIFTNPTRNHNTLLRFDAQPNASNSLNLRFGYLHNDAGAGNPDGNGLFTRDFSVLTTWTHTFSSSLFNQALVQIVPKNVANAVPNSPFQGVNFSLGSLNVGNLGGSSSFGSPTLVPYLAHQRRYQFDDNLTWTRGKHTFKFGEQTHLADYHVEDDLWFNNTFTFLDGKIPLISLAPPAVQAQLVGFNLSHGFPAFGPTNTNLSAPQSFSFGFPVAVRAGSNN